MSLPEKDDGSPFITRNSIKSAEAESQNAFWTLTRQDRYDELFDRIVDTSDLSKYFEEVTLIYHSCLEESIRERDGVDICVSDKLLVDLEPEKTGIGTHPINAYSHIIDLQKKGQSFPLLENLCNGDITNGANNERTLAQSSFATIENIDHTTSNGETPFYGHMGASFGLSESQQVGIHAYRGTKNSEVLAINGPPGTGKTTFLNL